MDNIAIPTSQNIAIEHTVASIGERIVASLIDYAFVFVYFIGVLFTGIQENSPLTFALITIPIAVFYHLLSELLMEGQSWGKKIMKIKVVMLDGSSVGLVSYFIRWVFRIADIWIFFGAISTVAILVNGKGQRLGDIAAHTTVIRIKKKIGNDTIYTELPENYNPSFLQVSMLKDSDIYTIKEILNYVNETYCSQESMQMASKAKMAIEKKLGISSDLRPEPFLKAIVWDYNFIHSR